MRRSPTKSDERPSESVGYPTEFRRTQNKLKNLEISESDRSRQASDRSPSDLKVNLKNGKKYLKMSPTDSFRSPSECNEVRGAISGSPREFENMQNKSDRTSFGPLKVRVGLLKFIKSPKQSPKSPTTFSDSD